MKRKKMDKIKTKITMQNMLGVFIVLCPILDIISFIFRNNFQTYISPSTFLRPIITIGVSIAIFIKSKAKRKNFNYMFNLCYIWNNSYNYI